MQNIDQAINRLLLIGAIEPSYEEKGQFLSSYFTVPKPDGTHRFILNLKEFNEFVFTEHFKLEDFRTAVNLLNLNEYMCKVDLEDAYLSVPIHKDFRKFLKFRYKGQLFQFTALPFGLGSSPYIFTKLMKPVVAYLRALGLKSVIYFDDFLLFGKNFMLCIKNLQITLDLLSSLGFIINKKKPNLNQAKYAPS